MHKVTAKQSRTARSLLKWNIHDLVNHVKGIAAKRIDSFEHGMLHLAEWENDELVKAFKKAGVMFKADLEVVLQKDEGNKEAPRMSSGGEGARIVLAADQEVLADSSADKVQTPLKPRAEEPHKDDKSAAQ